MRTPNLGSAFYAPGIPPENADELQRFLYEELQKISAVIAALAAGHIDPIYAAPTKPRKGDYRYADGASWNPGSGEGMYRFNGTSWVFLG